METAKVQLVVVGDNSVISFRVEFSRDFKSARVKSADTVWFGITAHGVFFTELPLPAAITLKTKSGKD